MFHPLLLVRIVFETLNIMFVARNHCVHHLRETSFVSVHCGFLLLRINRPYIGTVRCGFRRRCPLSPRCAMLGSWLPLLFRCGDGRRCLLPFKPIQSLVRSPGFLTGAFSSSRQRALRRARLSTLVCKPCAVQDSLKSLPLTCAASQQRRRCSFRPRGVGGQPTR